MDLIYTESLTGDMGNINAYEFDLAFGTDENDFELKIHADDHCCEAGYYVFFEGTEYGGIIDAVASDTENEEVIYTGRTWHGILNSKVLCPDAGEDYLTLNGDANTVLGSLIDRMGLSSLFEASSETSALTISNYKMDRYIAGYDGIRKMLKAVNGKLLISCVDTKVKLSAAPVVDYTASATDSEGLNSDVNTGFNVKKAYHKINHLICLGQGELSERTVVHLYADANGNISRTQTLTGIDEYSAVYDYPNAADTQELISGGTERLAELQKQDDLSVSLEEIEDVYDIGDIIGAIDYVTGVSIAVPISKKIVNIQGGYMTISYETDTAAAKTSYSNGTGVSVAGNDAVDYIVEQGTTGKWTWRKWSSGKKECWATFSTDIVSVSQWGSSGIYYGTWMDDAANQNGRAYPVTFESNVNCMAAPTGGDNDYWLILATSHRGGTILSHAPAYYVARPSNAAIKNPKISYYAIGE